MSGILPMSAISRMMPTRVRIRLKTAPLEHLEPMEVVQNYMNTFHRNMDQLNTLKPSIEPRASGHMIEQQEFVKQLLITVMHMK